MVDWIKSSTADKKTLEWNLPVGIVSCVGPVQEMEAKVFDGQEEATSNKFFFKPGSFKRWCKRASKRTALFKGVTCPTGRDLQDCLMKME